MGTGDAIIRDIVRLGDPYGVQVRGAVRSGRPPTEAILRELDLGNYNLLVLGVSPRPGEELSFGQVAGDYQEFRAGLGMMGAKEPAHAATQRTPYS